MLILSRKISERIVIGDGPDAVVITVADITRGKVRIGVTARKEIPVMREELLPFRRSAERPTEVAGR